MRGRKRRNKHNYLPPLQVEIYPREGTETQLHLFDLERGNVEIYPREGTETGRSVREFRAQRVEIYPREGTET